MSYPLWDQLKSLKESEWVDLTHTFDTDSPHFSALEAAYIDTISTVAEDGVLPHNMAHISMPPSTLSKTEDIYMN